MARIKLTLPAAFGFKTQIPVRIQDLNYGNHVGNDAILSIMHEARMQYLNAGGLKELPEQGPGLIMSDVAIVYKGEGFHGDVFEVEVTADEYTSSGFDLYYRISARRGDAIHPIAEAKTGMVCFDYQQHKVSRLPEAWKAQLA